MVRTTSRWVKVNVDGVVGGQGGVAFSMCVIRDGNGDWIVDFARKIGICLVLLAELWGAYDGLCRAWRLDYCKIELDLDNITVMKILMGETIVLCDNAITARIQELLSMYDIGSTNFSHCSG
ncbi:hypothetical protein V6N11_037695 [Hibiscus sabdariffa]|uniref:RNase H type-1 domain-containing protein n=1 Tax=Hibiscus sabdariffa TaxID=183260 RepID=A0ABR2PC24_9ROSI